MESSTLAVSGSSGYKKRFSLGARLAKAYLSLAPAYPPHYFSEYVPLVRAREEYEDEVKGGFVKWFGQIDFRSKRVLDLGSGFGGRTVRYKELGASKVSGLEITLPTVLDGRAFAASRGVEATFNVGVGENLPFHDNSFDIVTSYDVFEHVEDLGKVIDECWRVLSPGGTLYAVFPPFYHPTGSHLEGYVSKMPYANVIFSCEALRMAIDHILAERTDGYRPHKLRPKDKLPTLNGTTVRSFKKLLQESRFSQCKVTCLPLCSPMNSRWTVLRMKYYSFFFRPLRRIPLLRELFVHRIVCELSK